MLANGWRARDDVMEQAMTLGYYWANSHIQPVAGYYYLSLLQAQPPDNLRNVDSVGTELIFIQ